MCYQVLTQFYGLKNHKIEQRCLKKKMKLSHKWITLQNNSGPRGCFQLILFHVCGHGQLDFTLLSNYVMLKLFTCNWIRIPYHKWHGICLSVYFLTCSVGLGLDGGVRSRAWGHFGQLLSPQVRSRAWVQLSREYTLGEYDKTQLVPSLLKVNFLYTT